VWHFLAQSVFRYCPILVPKCTRRRLQTFLHCHSMCTVHAALAAPPYQQAKTAHSLGMAGPPYTGWLSGSLLPVMHILVTQLLSYERQNKNN
jgi:hypothetical protein